MTRFRIMKRRLLRGVVRDNICEAKGIPPRHHMLPNSLHLLRLRPLAMMMVVGVLAPLVYVAVMTSKALQAREPAALFSVKESVAPAIAPNVTESPVAAELVNAVSSPGLAALRRESIEPRAANDSAASDAAVKVEPPLPDPRLLTFQAFALGVKKIVIDPGHGGDDPGAVLTHGLNEKTITLDIGLRLRALLLDSAFEVRMTRETDETRSLVKRATFANEEGGDLFVSIHVNWLAPRWARVVETFYLGATEDQAVLQLAGAENRQSGYSMADLRRLLDGVYSDMKRGESRRLAESVQGELARALHDTNPASTARAVKTAPFAVLVGANMPAILTEVACLSNAEEAQLLATPEYRQHIAQALYTGIRSYANTLEQMYVMRKESPS